MIQTHSIESLVFKTKIIISFVVVQRYEGRVISSVIQQVFRLAYSEVS